MEQDVPLLIPDVNPDHLALVSEQRKQRKWKGMIVTNPNCTTVGLVMSLAPLANSFGLDKVLMTSMQAVSGAGYPGIPTLDILGNVIPYIGGEEEKVERETRKLLGKLVDGQVKMATPKPFPWRSNPKPRLPVSPRPGAPTAPCPRSAACLLPPSIPLLCVRSGTGPSRNST
jgi:hypothetical protein